MVVELMMMHGNVERCLWWHMDLIVVVVVAVVAVWIVEAVC